MGFFSLPVAINFHGTNYHLEIVYFFEKRYGTLIKVVVVEVGGKTIVDTEKNTSFSNKCLIFHVW